MPDLEACYFCGGVDGVTREPVLADDVVDPGVDPPTVALCPTCRDRLDAIVDQLHPPGGDNGAPESDEAADGPTTIDVQPGDTTEEPTAEPDDAPDTDPVAGDDDPPDRGVTIDTDDTSDDQAVDDRPDGYGKVLRFLRNRELPMARPTVVELVGSAYDLRHDEVEAALDYAIDHDTLTETDGDIRRP